MKKLGILVGIFITIYILGGVYLFIYQRDFMYFPTARSAHAFEIKQFSPDEETINVIVLNKGKQDAIIYFGGNGELVVNNAAGFIKTFPRHTIYLVNYRGYSGSSGAPTEQAFYSDAQYIYDGVATRHEKISVIGRSLGTGVATFLASTRAVDKMVLVTPYDSIQNLARDQYPIYPISLLLIDKYNSLGRIKDISSTTLIILAEHDAVIPFKYSAQLIKEFSPSQVTVEIIKGAGHNNLSQRNKYYFLLNEFL